MPSTSPSASAPPPPSALAPVSIDLTYCTNVHALGDAASWRRALQFFGPAIAQALKNQPRCQPWNQPWGPQPGLGSGLAWDSMPMGLWWQAPLAREAARNPAEVALFLRENGLRAFTCNAFPYGNFHDAVVKTRVYSPDWTAPERLAYTRDCALALAGLLPEGGFGSISTLPLGWRVGWTPEHGRAAAAQLLAFVAFARDLEDKTGRRLALALEPEPGCALERVDQVLNFWRDGLLPAALSSGQETYLSRYLGLCYDTCHQAVQFENPEATLDKLSASGIAIHKMQLSSALEFPPDGAKASRKGREAFAEPKFLHQTRVLAGDRGGSLSQDPHRAAECGECEVYEEYDDLPEALAKADWRALWRTHYHLPLQAESLLDVGSAIRTTRGDMLRAYHHALKHGLCRHFEVETYTWSVLPEAERPKDDAALAQALAREIAFVVANTPAGVAINP